MNWSGIVNCPILHSDPFFVPSHKKKKDLVIGLITCVEQVCCLSLCVSVSLSLSLRLSLSLCLSVSLSLCLSVSLSQTQLHVTVAMEAPPIRKKKHALLCHPHGMFSSGTLRGPRSQGSQVCVCLQSTACGLHCPFAAAVVTKSRSGLVSSPSNLP